ncbi:hypothetical protein DMB66_32750 [Actinoplanes sp. ATCC 53533]|nr:hypothetical protein DMB66_32750 [Actinoplanes sp. ATCC 53533]
MRRYGTIAGAATALGYTASAVSQQLAGLERDTGVTLVDRGPRSAIVNAAGTEFLSAAGDVLQMLDSARARAAAAVGRISGRVVVAAIPSVAPAVAAALARLRREEPLLDIALVQSSAPRAERSLIEGVVGIAVVDDWGTRPAVVDARLSSESCFAEPIVLAAHRDVVAGAGDDWLSMLSECLPHVPLLCATEGNYSREFADGWLARRGLSPRTRWEFDGLDMLAELVALAHGVAFLPASVVRRYPATVQAALPAPSTRTVNCLRRRDADGPRSAIIRCAQTLTAELASTAGSRLF